MMVTALKTIFGDIVDAVADDTDLITWAELNFGNKHNVYADISNDDPPTADDDSPYIIIAMPGRSVDQDRRLVEDRFNVFCCFTKNAVETTAYENMEFPSGINLMLDLERLLTIAIEGALPDRYSMAYDMDIDNIGVLPEIHAEFAVRLKRSIVLGETVIT